MMSMIAYNQNKESNSFSVLLNYLSIKFSSLRGSTYLI